MTVGREKEFPLSNYPPGVTGNEEEIVGVDKWLCDWPNCFAECEEDFEHCLEHTAECFWEKELAPRLAEDMKEIMLILADLSRDTMIRGDR